uniref:Uncharacterized protein n=1 Tax=Eptatretus burgeri TaxID=7764 RepID=A0A8C4NF61_EPTBU
MGRHLDVGKQRGPGRKARKQPGAEREIPRSLLTGNRKTEVANLLQRGLLKSLQGEEVPREAKTGES